MASEAMMQAIGRVERALARVEKLAGKLREERAEADNARSRIEEQQAAPQQAAAQAEVPVDIDPFSRDKAIAALKSLDALIGDLQKARSES